MKKHIRKTLRKEKEVCKERKWFCKIEKGVQKKEKRVCKGRECIMVCKIEKAVHKKEKRYVRKGNSFVK